MTAAPPEAAPHCAPRRGRTPVFVAVLLCAHCSLTVFAAVAALGLAFVPPLLVETAKWVVFPLTLLGLAGFLFFGARIAEAWKARRDA